MKKVIGTNVKCLTKTADGLFKQIAFARNAEITINRDFVEKASASTGKFKEYTPSRISWSVSIDALLCDEQELLYNMMYSGDLIDISWQAEEEGIEKFIYTGKAYIKSMKLTGKIHEMATFAANFLGSGLIDVSDY